MMLMSKKLFSKAVKFFIQAFEAGSMEGKLFYSICLLRNKGVSKNEDKGKTLLQECVDVQYLDAMFYFGLYYCENKSQKQRQFLELCAEKNHPGGLWYTGSLFYQGEGQRQKFIQATETGEPQYCLKLAHYYRKGEEGFPKDPHKAAEFEQKSKGFWSNISYFVYFPEIFRYNSPILQTQ
jgi:TPR repeat protein